MAEANGPKLGGRVLLALLTLYALAMIVPDFLRIVRPLGSFGLATNADGLIYDVQGPFAEEEESPAWRAGLRVGDRLDLAAMRCAPVDSRDLREQFGPVGRRQLRHARPQGDAHRQGGGRVARPARICSPPSSVRARSRSTPWCCSTGIAGVLVVLGAAYLVWIRPGAMTWGFFAYVIQFNPGPGVPVLRLAAAMAAGAAGAGRRLLRPAGCRLYRTAAVCAAGAGRSVRRPVAANRARPARALRPVPRASRS